MDDQSFTDRRGFLKKAGSASLLSVASIAASQPASAAAPAVDDHRLRKEDDGSCGLWYLPVDHHYLGVDMLLNEEASGMARSALVEGISTYIGYRIGEKPGAVLGALAGIVIDGQVAGELRGRDTITIGLTDTHEFMYIPNYGFATVPAVKASVYYWPNVERLPDPWDSIDSSEARLLHETSVTLDALNVDVPMAGDAPGFHTAAVASNWE